MQYIRNIFVAACLAMTAFALAVPAQAQAPWRSADTLKTEVYFGLRLPDGKQVSEEEWNKFLAEFVVPRFPNGLTVIDASGRSANAAKTDTPVNPTKLLVLVHPNVGDSQDKLAEVKTEFRKRFGKDAGIFHIDSPVRVAPEN